MLFYILKDVLTFIEFLNACRCHYIIDQSSLSWIQKSIPNVIQKSRKILEIGKAKVREYIKFF